ncbi:MAG: hypothetical protein NC833_05295 [Candidatus Omnitrophica bacterium]|nr:hypothetical protein [Candidatus Omnitrophota bacterium]
MKRDFEIIRRIAQKVKEIADHPIQKEKIEIWKKHNNLERVRPLILTFPEGSWREIISEDQLLCEDQYLRRIELDLRRRIYYWENIKDDSVIDDRIYSPIVIKNTGFGIEIKDIKPEFAYGARHFEPVIKEEKDIEKLKKPEISIDWEETERIYQKTCEAIDGILKVEKGGPSHPWFAPIDWFIKIRGINNFFVDMVDRPFWVHKVLNFITECKIEEWEFYEKNNVLSLNNGNHYVGSGGFGFTDKLPQPDFDGVHIRVKDLWGHATTQIFSLVSPEMHEEFALKYEGRFLSNFGLNCYGCCEPLDKKIDIIFKHIPRLRRISMSPWVDVGQAAEKLGKRAIFSWKPNPSFMASDTWEEDYIRKTIKDGLEKTKNCVVEVILKDIHTCRNKPERISNWVKIAKEIAERY